MHFTLAHFSDLHLGPLTAGSVFKNFKLKRVIGGVSWAANRRRLHLTAISNALRADILAAKPDHVAFTGDAVNIAAWSEFPHAADWFRAFGDPKSVSFVPGNHDTYVDVPWPHGLHHFQPWMTDDQEAGTPVFPTVRLRRNIALIGLNSGTPQSLTKAGGTLGSQQLRDLGHHLQRSGSQGFCRIVMIHHPPLPDLAIARKALTDAVALQGVLKTNGCELVLHGHNHRFMHNTLETQTGLAHVLGAPSASISPRGHHEAAGWNMLRIRRQAGEWQIELTRHVWEPDSGLFKALPSALLSPA